MLSVVINTLNEAEELPKVVKSVKEIASEIIVIDMESTDGTVKVAKKLGAKVFTHKKLDYVEPARNFGIENASGDWILIMDVDEELPKELRTLITKEIKNPKGDYYRISRKNIIFGKWIENSRWWPDYNIRLFKKGTVSWNEEIHRVPFTKGKGIDLESKENLAIIHNSYKNIDDYFQNMVRYSKIQSNELIKKGYKFHWSDLLIKPTNEFLSRFFAGQGYKDGVHGLALSLLQAFSELVLYIRIWNYEKIDLKKTKINSVLNKNIHDVKWWMRKEFSWLKNLVSV